MGRSFLLAASLPEIENMAQLVVLEKPQIASINPPVPLVSSYSRVLECMCSAVYVRLVANSVAYGRMYSKPFYQSTEFMSTCREFELTSSRI